ncbi:hypothetical protein KP509_31G047100 [Ceratopteris richardii]|uniref:Bulb-type lectin domain-containing protein n=1 Tax=Ceratopteris richardii TaxID=49495 RepID=A0A8T2QYZ0_CERRI|nr:hypothetical protein KP509_31G047100 [Ceratopteris richardii]
MAICCTIAKLSQRQVALASALVAALLIRVACAASSGDALPTLSWSSQLSITINVGNGSAIIKGSALVSPDHKSWALGIVVGTNNTGGLIPVSFGIFKATDNSSPAPTWEWQPVNRTDIASGTVSFSPGGELQLLVKWRNGTSQNPVAWTTDTSGNAQAVALTNTGMLLLLDADNKTIWQYPPATQGPSPAPAPMTACPADICLLPSPPPPAPPAPPPLAPVAQPKSPSRSAASASSPSFHLLLCFFFLAALSHFLSFHPYA